MVDASWLLYTRLQPQISKTSKEYVELFKASISLILFAASLLQTVCNDCDKQQQATDKIMEVLFKLEEKLWEWIITPSVIGGSFFGGNVASWKAKEEIEVI